MLKNAEGYFSSFSAYYVAFEKYFLLRAQFVAASFSMSKNG